MSVRIEEYRDKYPSLFDDNLISFGCGEGWRVLVDKICIALLDTDAKIIQLKEKFALLTCYIESSDKELKNKINEICYESSKICEDCGTVEDVQTRGSSWIKKLCEDCAFKRGW